MRFGTSTLPVSTQALRQLLEQRLSTNTLLTEFDVRGLYSRNISGRDADASERAQGKLRVLLTEAASSSASAGAQVGVFQGNAWSRRPTVHRSGRSSPNSLKEPTGCAPSPRNYLRRWPPVCVE